ncbi:alpha/beta fold hydrolase [Roseomonas hellenica]|uniref:Alpha/beta fold hydrolase n=1 Tax=Plastoroseomonas hellenica TaxID=2687306 RepID=A0ABS5F8S4_9PROT|nr:alpha/beta fold hydrolase [Plastoroseomonas hellenica]MBR0668964.1 alpha/beta fold hydrolase [Plastoroseomonas hellenica]
MDPVAALLAEARRIETPCGEGRMVWHAWGQGAPMALFHGGVGSWRHWLRTIPAWKGSRHLLVPDLPGLGESDLPPEPAAIETVAAVVAKGLLSQLGPNEQVDLVGFSFGSTVGAHVALIIGDRARSLTLIGAGGLVPAKTPMILEKVRGKTGDELREAHRTNLGLMMIADPAGIDDLALDLQDWNSRHSRLDTRAYVAAGALRRALERLRVPVDAIWGERDQLAYWGLPERVAALRALQPDARVTILPGVGHWIAYEDPAALDTVLHDYLDNPRPSPGVA